MAWLASPLVQGICGQTSYIQRAQFVPKNPSEIENIQLGKWLAPVYNSIFRMMTSWVDADKKEREEIVADLQEMIDDSGQRFEERPALKQRDVEKVVHTIREFKDRLTILINERGGVTEVAKKIGMPQSSLSRLLNSASMPRRITLLKIAKVLGLSEAEIATEYVRWPALKSLAGRAFGNPSAISIVAEEKMETSVLGGILKRFDLSRCHNLTLFSGSLA